jgi:hypothetical protein
VNDQITNTKISDFFNKYPGVGSSSWRQQCEDHIHWIGRIFNANLTLFKQDQYNIGEIEIEMGLTDSKKKITLNPRNLGSLRPCPIPWQIRFPFIFCLETLHPWPVKGKGRPQDWRLNVLVYELSQAGIKDKEIGNLLRKCPIPNLLFGAIKHYEGTLDKDPILVRINTIKRTVEKAVSQAYPFTAST